MFLSSRHTYSAWSSFSAQWLGTIVDNTGDGLVSSTLMTEGTSGKGRRYQRISLPKGMDVVWYGAGQQQVSRVRTLGMGGVFISVSISPPLGTNLKLIFEVPGGVVAAEGVVRNIVPGEGMGVEFTKLGPTDRVLLGRLLKRLLR